MYKRHRVSRHEVTQPLDESYRLIPLTQGQNAIVDAADFEWLSKWNWQAQWDEHTKGFYARRALYGGGAVIMHRLIYKSPCKQVDHKNHNTLDNRKLNLRGCNQQEN